MEVRPFGERVGRPLPSDGRVVIEVSPGEGRPEGEEEERGEAPWVGEVGLRSPPMDRGP